MKFMPSKDTLHFFILDEISLFQAFLFLALSRRVCIIDAQARLRVLDKLLKRFMAFLWRRFPGSKPENALPDMPWYEGDPAGNSIDNFHKAIEDALHAALPALAPAHRLGEYAYPMKKAVTDYTGAVTPVLAIIEWFEGAHPVQAFAVHGASPHLGRIYEMYFGRHPSFTRTQRTPSARVVNVVNVLTLIAGIVVWLAQRTRPGFRPKRSYFIGLDLVSGRNHELTLIDQVLDGKAEKALIVYRTPALKKEFSERFIGVPQCVLSDTKVSVSDALYLVTCSVRDAVGLWFSHGGVEAQLFQRYCFLAVKRSIFSAFLRCFPVTWFWGRDDYSLDHIIRNQELRKLGGKSIGMNHAVNRDTYQHQWREIDFDVFYTFDSMTYEKFHKDSWPAHMRVRSINSDNLTAERKKKACGPRPQDIVYFPVVHRYSDYLLGEVFKIARHFPERIVYVKMKAGRPEANMKDFRRLMATAPDNVRDIEPLDSSYDLMLDATYILNCGSTLAVEALQFRSISLVFDVEPRFRYFFYRNVPGMIVKSAEDVIAKIEAHEEGSEKYPFEDYVSMLGLNEEDFYLTVRRDLGIEDDAATMAPLT
jgi:hypothetical protein